MKFLPNKAMLKAASQYLLIGSLVFAIGLFWHFPYDRFRQLLTSWIAKSTGYTIQMDSFSPVLPLGIKARNVEIQSPSFGRLPFNLELDSIRATLSPISAPLCFIKNKCWGSYSVMWKKERWKGNYDFGPESSAFKLRTKNLKLDHSFPLGGMNPTLYGSDLKIQGVISFETGLNGNTPALFKGDLSTSDGMLKLRAQKGSIKAPLLKPIPFDSLAVEAEMKEGAIDIKSIKIASPSVSGNASGSLKISPFYPRSQLSLSVKLTISDKEIKTLAQTFATQQGLKVDERGVTAIKITGPLNRLSIRSF